MKYPGNSFRRLFIFSGKLSSGEVYEEICDVTKLAGTITIYNVSKLGGMAPEDGEAAGKNACTATSLVINNRNIND